jgi:hypothetical protein
MKKDKNTNNYEALFITESNYASEVTQFTEWTEFTELTVEVIIEPKNSIFDNIRLSVLDEFFPVCVNRV